MLKEVEKLIKFLNKNNFKKEAAFLIKQAEECKPPFTSKDAEEVRDGRRLRLGEESRSIGYAKETLKGLGYYYGNIDCVFDNDFLISLRDFEKDNDVMHDGTFSIGTLVTLDMAKGLRRAKLKKNRTNNRDIKIKNNKRTEEYPEWNKFKIYGTNFNKAHGRNNYRSAQVPEEKDFFEFLNNKYGIKNIINLRKDSEKERRAVLDAGLNYLNIHLTSKPPTESEWEKIKNLLRQGNTLVHCQHGADRTGAVLARWEVEEGNKTPEQAYNDSLKYGFKDENFEGYYFDAEGNPTNPDPNKDLRRYILKG
ncbi:tyrosine-protein phosphatase [bacterium]|nr:tyrosine-protein phosphatase [bacterium]